VLIAEELVLLGLDERTGARVLSGEKLDPALGGALLVELVLLKRVDVAPASAGWRQRGRVRVISADPTGDPELDRTLAAVQARDGRRAKDLISSMSFRRITKGLRDRLLERLATAGVLARRRGTVLGFLPRTVWPTVNPGPAAEVRERLRSALVDGLSPSERTVALISLLHATGHLTKVVPTDDRTALKARAKALSEGDWAGDAVRRAIQEVYAATVSVTAGAAAASAG
jgi:hypothetical protein